MSNKAQKSVALSSKELLENYRQAYREFDAYYVQKKCEGCEIFISHNLKELLIEWWRQAEQLYDNESLLGDKDRIFIFEKNTMDVLKQMEKIYGLMD